MHSVPEAITCFLEGENYEDTLRNVAFIGGDTDTLGAISGAMAEAYWGIPECIKRQGGTYLKNRMREILDEFDAYRNRVLFV